MVLVLAVVDINERGPVIFINEIIGFVMSAVEKLYTNPVLIID